MSVQRISRAPRPQASRLRPVPEGLRKYIDRANLLPPFEDAPELLPPTASIIEINSQQWNSVGIAIRDLAARFPSFREYMKEIDLQQFPPIEAYQRSRSLRVVRDALRALARCDKSKLVGEAVPMGAYLESLVSARMDDQGNLRIEYDPLLQAIDGVDASRVRECPVCRQIFWAGRTDQPCCGKRCAGIRRTRRWRDRYFEKYKKQRITKAQATDALQDTAARDQLERKKLERQRAPTFARRAVRLPRRLD